MSYAGTYGDDETCRHGSYWRSCGPCSLVGPRATDEQIAEAKRRREADIRKAENLRQRKTAERHTSTVVRDGFVLRQPRPSLHSPHREA